MLIASLVKLHLPLHETCFLFRQGCSKKGKMSFTKPKPNFGIGMFININILHRVLFLVISNFWSISNEARQNKSNVDVLHLFSATFKSSENSDPLAFWCNHQQPLSHPPSGGGEGAGNGGYAAARTLRCTLLLLILLHLPHHYPF